MPKIARQGDDVTTGHLCDTTTKLAAPTDNDNVYAEGALICRFDDKTEEHEIEVPGPACVKHTTKINKSSSTVYVRGKKVARVTDTTGCSSGSSIDSGAGTVFNTK